MILAEELTYVWYWAPIAYASFILTLFQAFKNLFNPTSRQAENLFYILGFLGLTVGIGAQGSSGLSIISSLGTSLIALAWFVLFFSFLINLRLKTSLLTLLVIPLSLLLLSAGLRLGTIEPIDESNLLEKSHIFLTLLGMTMALLAAVASVVFYFQDLKLKRQIKTLMTLPSLDTIHRIIRVFDKAAFFFLTGAIGTGGLYAKSLYGPGWSAQMPWIFIFTLLTWSVLAIIVISIWKSWLQGKRLALSNLVLLVFVLLTLLGGNHL